MDGVQRKLIDSRIALAHLRFGSIGGFMRFSNIAAAAFAFLLSCPALAADTPSQDHIRYDNYVLCIGYTKDLADSMKSTGDTQGETDARAASGDMVVKAKTLLSALKLTETDMNEDIVETFDDLSIEMYSMDDQQFQEFDIKLGDHCAGVWIGNPSLLDKKFDW